MIISDMYASPIEPTFILTTLSTSIRLSFKFNDHTWWSVDMAHISYHNPKQFIKYIKRKDGAPRHFLKRILNYIK